MANNFDGDIAFVMRNLILKLLFSRLLGIGMGNLKYSMPDFIDTRYDKFHL